MPAIHLTTGHKQTMASQMETEMPFISAIEIALTLMPTEVFFSGFTAGAGAANACGGFDTAEPLAGFPFVGNLITIAITVSRLLHAQILCSGTILKLNTEKTKQFSETLRAT
jgi:hypothetical protein